MARDPMDHPTFQKTLEAHEDEIFKKKGTEPTNFGADVNASEPKVQSWITSKTSNGVLHTHHDHKTGIIKHTWSHTKVAEEEQLDELNYKAILQRYRAKAKSKERAKTADSAKKPVAKPVKKAVNEEPVEYYDALERKRKADWHYKRAGKTQGASLSKGIKHDYEAELLKRGVKDSNGNQKSLRKEDMNIVDLVLTQDEIEYDVYRDEFEGRINALVDAKKQEMKQGVFSFEEGLSKKGPITSQKGSWADQEVNRKKEGKAAPDNAKDHPILKKKGWLTLKGNK